MSIVASWLRHCLEERDLVRVVEPLLCVMLHPRTHCAPLQSLLGKQNFLFFHSDLANEGI